MIGLGLGNRFHEEKEGRDEEKDADHRHIQPSSTQHLSMLGRGIDRRKEQRDEERGQMGIPAQLHQWLGHF
jgi:hypothetical protein